jgi:serine/threonine-protein kinase PRP4
MELFVIVLGIPYDFAIDVWSVACTLYELYTGKILFPGRSNNQMLHLMMDCKGRIPYRLLKRAQFAPQYFNNIELGESFVQFNQVLADGTTRRITPQQRPVRDIKSRILTDAEKRRLGGDGDDWRLLVSFVDLLEKCLTLSSDKRLSTREALNHPFITGIVKS